MNRRDNCHHKNNERQGYGWFDAEIFERIQLTQPTVSDKIESVPEKKAVPNELICPKFTFLSHKRKHIRHKTKPRQKKCMLKNKRNRTHDSVQKHGRFRAGKAFDIKNPFFRHRLSYLSAHNSAR